MEACFWRPDQWWKPQLGDFWNWVGCKLCTQVQLPHLSTIKVLPRQSTLDFQLGWLSNAPQEFSSTYGFESCAKPPISSSLQTALLEAWSSPMLPSKAECSQIHRCVFLSALHIGWRFTGGKLTILILFIFSVKMVLWYDDSKTSWNLHCCANEQELFGFFSNKKDYLAHLTILRWFNEEMVHVT